MVATAQRRVKVLRGFEARDADLGTIRAASARHLVVDPELVESATQDGYRAGYQAGFDAALLDAAEAIDSRERKRAQELSSALDQLAIAATNIEGEHAGIVAVIEQQVISLAVDLAEVLVGHSIAHNTESGRAALRRALQLSPPGCPVTARLHPDDCATLGSVADLDEYANRSVNIIEDPALQRGDCVVDADATRIDARIAPALDRLREVIAR